MRYLDIITLREAQLPDLPSIQRRFDFFAVDNRRFIYDPVARRFVIGAAWHLVGAGDGLNGSHAEDWFNLTGSNSNFDRCLRGWVGTGGSYRSGIIHFAPPVSLADDATYKCLAAFVASGAIAKTKVRGLGGLGYNPGEENNLGEIAPDLFRKTA